MYKIIIKKILGTDIPSNSWKVLYVTFVILVGFATVIEKCILAIKLFLKVLNIITFFLSSTFFFNFRSSLESSMSNFSSRKKSPTGNGNTDNVYKNIIKPFKYKKSNS